IHKATDFATRAELGGIGRHVDRPPHHGRRLQGLGRTEIAGHRIDGAVQLLNPLQRTELGQLRDKLTVVLGIQRALVLHLGNHQFHEGIFAQLIGLGALLGGHAILAEYVVGPGNAIYVTHDSVPRSLRYWPSVRTRCILDLAEFMTSTFIWKLRDDEIMSAISSTTLTFGYMT